jgi:hypothetical protein
MASGLGHLGNVRRGYLTLRAFEHGLILPFGKLENLKPFWKALDSEIIALGIGIFSDRSLYVSNLPANRALDRFGDVIARSHPTEYAPRSRRLGYIF